MVSATDASFIDLTGLFGSLIAANVFVPGVLLAGTLADYKESERLPGELAASIETISDEFRDTPSLSVGYSMSYIGTVALLGGLLFANIEPYYRAMFYLVVIGFLLIYLTVLIKDVDNPFDHYKHGAESASVSLKPIFDIDEKLRGYTEALGALSIPSAR